MTKRNKNAPGVWAIMTPVIGQVRYAMALSALGAVASLAALGGLAWAIHDLIDVPDQWPWRGLAIAFIATAGAFLLKLFAFNQSHFAAFRLETTLRTQLSEHLARVPLGYVQQTGAGALTKVMMDDVKSLHAFVADSMPLYARAYVSPILTFIVLWVLDWSLALVATAIMVFGLGVIARAMKGRGEMIAEYNASRERVSTAVVEYVQAMPVVRTFDSGTTTFGRYQRALDAYLDIVTNWYRMAGFPARFSLAVLNPMPTIAMLVWLGGWMITHDTLDPATWVAVLLIGAGMAEAVLPLMALQNMIAQTQTSIRRIQDVLSQPVLAQPSSQPAVPTDASVRFENVSFRYTENGATVLNDISFIAPAGKVTALVGPSGAGKTTVARLIPRFWDVSDGRILIGGADIRNVDSDTLMEQVAFVFQDTFLFAASIADNIRLGTPDMPMERVIDAAKAAQAHDFIMSLPNGYDTPTGERGVFLSGGQRQRITIARAILQNRPILVLDEATAFADPENEAALVRALSQLMRGKTVLIVAHRLSTMRDADQILVFDKGHLVEHGPHDAIVAQNGTYTRLWTHYERARNWSLDTHTGDRA